ncbi:MAG: hypothetical protein IPL47_16345 [Phyllobacteriaceae bacterium]|nr:hypothetical protein [Phyllobacteriaceae bacterium]
MRLAASTAAVALAIGSVSPAFADVTNTATATGSSPSGTGDVTDASNTVAVDPVDAAPGISILKTAVITTDGDSDLLGDSGDVVTYTYTVTNTGTTSLLSVDIVDTHDGDGAAPSPLFASWTTQAGSPAATVGASSITMYPGAVAVFTATYSINGNDILAAGGTGVGLSVDNDIDNSAVATGDYFNGVTTTSVPSAASLASVPLDIDAVLSVAKTAYEVDYPVIAGGSASATTPVAVDRPVGTVIYYVYEITNSGNVPITNVTINDVHNGLPGPFTQPVFFALTNTSGLSNNAGSDATVELLHPGDVAIYRTSYTITQDDVDQNQ